MIKENPWKEKLKISMALATTKGLKVEAILGAMGYWVHLPDNTKKRFNGIAKMIDFINNYKA